jgi:hypothetical protein
MPALAFAMTDMAPSRDGNVPAGAVTVAGGCGVCHEISVDAEHRPHIACDICAPILTGSHYGWASTPHGVPLTPDELASRELAKRDVEASQAILVNAAVQNMLLGQQQPALPAPAPSVADVLSKASPEELLAALPDEMRAALEAAVAAQTLAAKEPAAVKPGAARTQRTPRTAATTRR